MTARSTAATNYRPHFLIAAAGVIAVLAYFWFWPDPANSDRLAMLQADSTLELPELAGEVPELLETETNVASRSWDGSWSITEHTDHYALISRRVNRYAEDIVDHVDESPWELTALRCTEDQLVLTARQPIDGDWATLEITAWAVGANGRMTVRSAISAVAGTSLVTGGDSVDVIVDCPEVS